MKIIQTILILYVVAFICSTSCKNDDGGDLLPVNRLPGTFEITTIISDNSAVLTWTPAVDPDGDVVTYDIVLEGDTVASDITSTSFSLADLRFEKDYAGKLVAKDSKGESVAEDFSFTTGFLFLKSYEEFGREYFLEYNDEKELVNVETVFSDNNPLVRNAEGKLINVAGLSMEYSSGGYLNSINDGNGEGIIEYDSHNRIARMSTDYNSSPTVKLHVVRDHTYNEQGQLIQLDETVYNFSTRSYSYARFIMEYDGRDNVIQVVWENSYDNVVFQLSETRIYTYDDKKNPWYTLLTAQTNFDTVNINGNLLKNTLFLSRFGVYSTNWMSKNNLTRVYIDSGTENALHEYSYSYNDDDYPIAAEIDYTFSDSPPNKIYSKWHY